MLKVFDLKNMVVELRNQYDQFAESGHYDLVHGGYQKDFDLYKKYVSETGGPVLEVMCGTGRLLFFLARLGYNVMGIDSSPVMVKICLEKMHSDSALQNHIQVQVADACNFNLKKESHYGLALIAYGSFGHLITKENKLKSLRCIKRNLKPEGILIIDDINGIAWANKKYAKGSEWKPNEVLDQVTSDMIVRRFSKYEDDRSSHLMTRYDNIQLVNVDGEVKQEYKFKFCLAYAPAEDTVELLRETGFQNVTVYGTYHDAVKEKSVVKEYDFSHPSSNKRQVFIAN